MRSGIVLKLGKDPPKGGAEQIGSATSPLGYLDTSRPTPFYTMQTELIVPAQRTRGKVATIHHHGKSDLMGILVFLI